MAVTEDMKEKAADMMKKVLTVGVGTLFLTEEALKGLVGDLKVPKELLGGILQSANRTKNEFLQQIAQEVMGRLKDKIDPKALVEEILQRNDIEFTVKMRFRAKDDSKTESPSEGEQA